MSGGTDAISPSPAGGGPAGEAGRGGAVSNVTALTSHAPRTEVAGSAALKAEPEAKLSPAQALEQMQWTKAEARSAAAEKRAEARAKGYEGEACGECGNFTLVRNGTCLKCDTCGSTTGCS
jgi:ribonucleoside-diphosphate reductase alpha chain